MGIIEKITNAMHVFFGFSSNVTIVGLFIIIVLFVRVPLKKGILGALKVSIGLQGIMLIVNLIQQAMAQPVSNIVKIYGFNKSVVDIGWGCLTYAFGNTYGYFGVLLFLILNVFLVYIRFLQTVYVDIFNTWRAMLLGGLVGVASNNFWMATLAVIVFLLIDTKAADIAAPHIEKVNNFPPGGSWPHGSHFSFQACIAIPIEWVLKRVPVVKDINIKAETIEEKFGVLGDSTVMGALVGIFIGLISQIGIMPSLLLGVEMSAAFLLLPRMASILVEGWFPIIKAARKLLTSKLHRNDVRIALDCSTVIGHPAVTPTTLIMYPIALFISLVLPGNTMIASVSLIIVLWESAAVNSITEGNIFHNIIIESIIICLFCWGASYMSQPMTALAGTMKYDVAKGAISAWDATGTPLVAAVYKIFSLIFGF